MELQGLGLGGNNGPHGEVAQGGGVCARGPENLGIHGGGGVQGLDWQGFGSHGTGPQGTGAQGTEAQGTFILHGGITHGFNLGKLGDREQRGSLQGCGPHGAGPHGGDPQGEGEQGSAHGPRVIFIFGIPQDESKVIVRGRQNFGNMQLLVLRQESPGGIKRSCRPLLPKLD